MPSELKEELFEKKTFASYWGELIELQIRINNFYENILFNKLSVYLPFLELKVTKQIGVVLS